MDEVAQLNNEDQSAYETRAGLPRRLRMMSGFAVDLPAPANDLAREIAKAVAMEAAPDFMKRFAVSVRPKAKVAVQMPPALSDEDVTSASNPLSSGPIASSLISSGAVSSGAILSRVTLAAPEMPAAKRKPAPSIEWEYPSVDLLAVPRKADGVALTADMLEQNARLLETTLEDFGIRGEIIHVRAGPVVTLYELEPAPGMKSSRVIGLADDIARSMSALSAAWPSCPAATRSASNCPTSAARRCISARWWKARSSAIPSTSSPSRWARRSAANPSSPNSPRCRICSSPAPPARASRSPSTR